MIDGLGVFKWMDQLEVCVTLTSINGSHQVSLLSPYVVIL